MEARAQMDEVEALEMVDLHTDEVEEEVEAPENRLNEDEEEEDLLDEDLCPIEAAVEEVSMSLK